jgi:hypothetical protein
MKLDPGIHIVMHSILSLKTRCDNVTWAIEASDASSTSPVTETVDGATFMRARS